MNRETHEPPHSLDAEESLLACVLIDGADTLAACEARGIFAASFYDTACRTIYELADEVANAGTVVDEIVLGEELRKRGLLDAVGGIARLNEITNRVPTTAHRGYFIDELRVNQTRRELIEKAGRGAEIARRHTGTEAELREQFAATVASGGTTASRARPFTLWRPSQFLGFVRDPSARLIGAGVLEKGDWLSIVGIGGLGKTRLATWLCVAQQTGRDWCGLKTSGAPQKALILSSENGLSRWHDDFVKIVGTLTEQERAVVDEHTRALALTADEDADLCLGSPGVDERIAATLKQETPGIIVFDPFADMIDGDENKTADMVATLAKLRKIVRTSAPEAAVVVIHHGRTGSSNIAQAGDNFSAGNFARGSKALSSKVRCEIQLAPADKDDPNRLVLACGKCNNGPRFATRGLIFDPESFTYEVDHDFDVEAWRADVAGKRRETAVSVADVVEAVRTQYRTGTDVSTGDIVQPLRTQTGASAKTIQRRLSEAKSAGYLRDGSKRGTWRLGSKPLLK